MNYSELSTAIQDYAQNSETTFLAHLNDFIIAAEDKIFMAIQMPAFWKADSTQVTASGTAEYTLPAGVLDIFSARIGETAVSGAEEVVDGPVRYLLRKDYDFMLEAYPGTNSAQATGTPKHYAVSSASSLASTVTTNGTLSESTGVTAISDTSSISIGMNVSGTGIAADTVVTAVPSGSTVTLSIAATVSSTESLTFATTSPSMTIRLGPAPDAIYPLTVDYYGKTVADSITAGSTPALPLTTETWLSVTAPDTLLYGALVQGAVFTKDPELLQVYEAKFSEGLIMLKNMGEGRQVQDVYTTGQKTVPVQ